MSSARAFFQLFKQSYRTAIAAAVFAILEGLTGPALIALISAAISEVAATSPRFEPARMAGFMALGVVTVLFRLTSYALITRYNQQLIFDLRLRVARQIVAAPLRRLEEHGSHQLWAALTEDVHTVSDALSQTPQILASVTALLAYMGYLFFLSPPLLLAMLLFFGAGLAICAAVLKSAVGRTAKMLEVRATLYKHFRGVVDGIKELKLNALRRREFVDGELQPTAAILRQANARIYVLHEAGWTVMRSLYFLYIGLLLFAFPRWIPVPGLTLTAFVLTVLSIRAPLEILFSHVQQIGRGAVTLQRLEALGLAREEEPTAAPTPPPSWERIALQGLTHQYRTEGTDIPFVLGPVDLEIGRGELLFIVGGNGSGKTTLGKLIAGLYVPEAGHISVDGQEVAAQSRDAYRQMFSAVFSEFFVFERLLSPPPSQGRDGDPAEAYLRRLALHQKVRIEAGRLSTRDLSSGQRKRLALLAAYLEDRPILLFDEWASDQDPSFKNVFYRELLPELRGKGKTVIVITHDDRYFDVADRIAFMENGQLRVGKGQSAGRVA